MTTTSESKCLFVCVFRSFGRSFGLFCYSSFLFLPCESEVLKVKSRVVPLFIL